MTDLGKYFEGKNVGLALGVGGARGAAHLGVMRALRSHGISVSHICGCSSGSLFGAICASGNVETAEKWFDNLTWWKAANMFFEFRIPWGGGWLKGSGIERMVREIIPQKTFAELPTKLCLLAADIYTGEQVHIGDGDLMTAVKASCAVPALFKPVKFGDRWLIDGGIMNALPVTACREMGADVVIGVDVNLGRSYRKTVTPKSRPSIGAVFNYGCRLIENAWTNAGLQLDKPEILIQPPVRHISRCRVRTLRFAIKAGELEANRELERFAEAHG